MIEPVQKSGLNHELGYVLVLRFLPLRHGVSNKVLRSVSKNEYFKTNYFMTNHPNYE